MLQVDLISYPQPPLPWHGQRSKPTFPTLDLLSILFSSFSDQEDPAKVHRSAKIALAYPMEKPSSATAEYGKASAGVEMHGLGGNCKDWGGWGRGGWLHQGLPGGETLRSPGSCRSQTAGKQPRLRGDKEVQDGHSAVRGS